MSKKPSSITEIEKTVALLPLSGALLLPQTQRPLMIYEPRYVALVDHILAGSRLIGLIQPVEDTQESPSGRNVALKDIGSLGYLRGYEEHEEGKYFIVLEGISRFSLRKEIQSDTAFRMAEIDCAPYTGDFNPEVGEDQVNREEFLRSMRAYSKFADIEFDWSEVDDTPTSRLINLCCMLSPYGAKEKQALLEATSLNQRAQTLMALAEMEMAAGSHTPGSNLQ